MSEGDVFDEQLAEMREQIQRMEEIRREVENTLDALKLIDLNTRTVRRMRHGQIAVGTAQVQMPSFRCDKGVTIKGDDDNTDNVFVGLINVTAATGFRLDAGQAVTLPYRVLEDIYIIADAAGQEAHYVAL